MRGWGGGFDPSAPPAGWGRGEERLAAGLLRTLGRAGLGPADVDLILVGDSLGMVIQGHDTTVPVTVSDMVYHCRTVARGLRRAFLVADMPFMSYTKPDIALDNAVRLMQEGGAMMVKLEGGDDQVAIVEHLARHDIPVCAHLGLKPQSVHRIGGFKVQGRDKDKATEMLESAKRLQDAGADIVLLECVPNEVGKGITNALEVPVIGIGAGPDCDGQVLVIDDMLGLFTEFRPKFVKRYANLGKTADEAIAAYAAEVRARAFPGDEHSFPDVLPPKGSK